MGWDGSWPEAASLVRLSVDVVRPSEGEQVKWLLRLELRCFYGI